MCVFTCYQQRASLRFGKDVVLNKGRSGLHAVAPVKGHFIRVDSSVAKINHSERKWETKRRDFNDSLNECQENDSLKWFSWTFDYFRFPFLPELLTLKLNVRRFIFGLCRWPLFKRTLIWPFSRENKPAVDNHFNWITLYSSQQYRIEGNVFKWLWTVICS